MSNTVKFDKDTKNWFANHTDAEATIMICDKCGLGYIPVLGHKCKFEVKPKMTNYEKIKNMSVEEMAAFLLNITPCYSDEKCLHPVIYFNDNVVVDGNYKALLEWLNKEVSE